MANKADHSAPEEHLGVGLKQLGERIRAIRISKGYSSFERFANDHNIHRAQYARYEKGNDIRFSTLVRLCNAFGMSLKEFFSEGFDA